MLPVQLSIIVPAYKQEKQITTNLKSLDEVLKGTNLRYEIICVVDGFLDKTFQNAKKIANKQIIILGYPNNAGKGFAVRFGMSQARGEIIGFMDAGDLDYKMLPMLLQHFYWYHADAVIASKRHPVSQVKYPWPRKILSWGYQMGVKTLFGLNIRDTQVGMKLFRKELINKVLPRLLVKQYAFDIEMLAVAHYLGFTKIYEAPVKLKLDFSGASSILKKGFLRNVWGMAWDTVAVFYRLYIRHFYDDANKKEWLGHST